MDQMEGVIADKLAYYWKRSVTKELTVNQEDKANNEMSAFRKNRVLHKNGLNYDLWKEMMRNIVEKESMKEEYWKSGSEHDEEDLKKSKARLLAYEKLQTLEVLWMRKIYVFGATRGSLPQIIVPKGGREAKELFIAFWIFYLSLLNLL